MLHLNENIEEQYPSQEEVITDTDYLTRADVSALVDEQEDNAVSITNDIISSIDSLSNPTSFKRMIEEAVKKYMEEMKNAAS